MCCEIKKELLLLHKLKSSSDMDYLRRIADEELSLRLEAFGAVQINGPKWCGKTKQQKDKQRVWLSCRIRISEQAI